MTTKTKTPFAMVAGMLLVTGITVITVKEIQDDRNHSAGQRQKEMAMARLGQAHSLALGFIMYANKYGQYPTNFGQIDTKQYPINGTDDFEIVYKGSPHTITNFFDTIVIQEAQPWQTTGGNWAKVYVFADGHAEVHAYRSQWRFRAFEQQHSGLPGSGQ